MEAKRLISKSAIREAFHERGTSLPRGFLDDVEADVLAAVRKVVSSEFEPDGSRLDGDARFIRVKRLKEHLRSALGKQRIDPSFIAHINGVIEEKVLTVAERRMAADTTVRAVGVPSVVLRRFLHSEEHQSRKLSWEKFFQKWQSPEWRKAWEEAHGIPSRKAREPLPAGSIS